MPSLKKTLTSLLGPYPLLKGTATLVLMGVGGWFLFQSDSVSLEKIQAALALFDAVTLFQVFACIVLQIGLMVARLWWIVPGHFPLFGVLRAVAFGHAVNAVVPAKMGEALKAVLLGRLDSNRSLGVGIGVLVADRIADFGGLSLLVLTSGVLGLPLLSGERQWNWPMTLAVAFGVGAALVCLVRYGSRRWEKVRSVLQALWLGLRGMGSPVRALAAFVTAWGAWAIEVIAIQWLSQTLGYPVTFAQGAFVLVVLNLAILVPVSMANVGTFEASVVFALASFGVATEPAVVVAGTLHGIHLLAIGCWALIGWGTLGFRWGFAGVLGREVEVAASETARLEALRLELKVTPEFQKVWEALALTKEDRFLDVSCQHGLFSVEAKAQGAYVYSCDVQPSQVLSLVGVADETEVASPEHLMVEGKFSRVLLAQGTTPWEDPVAAFSQSCRRVAPGGRLVVHAPLACWQAETLASVAGECQLALEIHSRLGVDTGLWVWVNRT